MRVGPVGLGMGAVKHAQTLKTLAGRVYLPHLRLIEDMLAAIPRPTGRGSIEVHCLIDMLMKDTA